MNAHESFTALLLRHEPDIRGFICAFMLDPDEREDLFQETALTMLRSFGDLRSIESFASWGRGIAGRMQMSLDAVHQALSRLRGALQDCIRRRLKMDETMDEEEAL